MFYPCARSVFSVQETCVVLKLGGAGADIECSMLTDVSDQSSIYTADHLFCFSFLGFVFVLVLCCCFETMCFNACVFEFCFCLSCCLVLFGVFVVCCLPSFCCLLFYWCHVDFKITAAIPAEAMIVF